MYQNYIKRGIDFLVSGFFCLLCLPFFIVIALLIKIDSRGPIFFKQKRVGQNLRTFEVLKLRTMTHQDRKVGNQPVIGKADGVTTLGFYLRRFKIDELPQLLNVFKGDMSLVGPRPSVPEQLEQMTEQEKHRYSVRPGLTGLSQVSGNIHLSWKERYVYDLEYVAHISLMNDVKIILKTFLIILFGEEKYLHKSKNLIKKK
ncbi:MAG: sugar transferase [Bacteroidetes bacterium]|nr:sugar transferase [Bacteroidota bacterium]